MIGYDFLMAYDYMRPMIGMARGDEAQYDDTGEK